MANRKQRRRRASKRRSAPPVKHPTVRPRRPDWPVFWLGVVGMLITAFLSFQASTTGGLPLCTEGSACDLIQQSRWSMLFGIPVAVWGLLTYALITLLSWEMRPSVKRWRWLWTLSLLGLGISLYLTIVGIVQIEAICLWCMASLATIAAIFGVLSWRRPESGPGKPWKVLLLDRGAMLVLILALMHLHYGGYLSPGFGAEDPQLQALAEHLAEEDARFYGAFWCPACQEQMDLFGASQDRLPYVECTPDGRGGVRAAACVTAGVETYPTWIIEDRRHTGVLEPRELARLSGFDWEEE